MKSKHSHLILIIVLSFSSLAAQEIIPIDRSKLRISENLEHVKVKSTIGNFEGYAYGVDEFNLFLLEPKCRNILKLHYSEILKVNVNTDNANSLYAGGLTVGIFTGFIVGVYTPPEEDDYWRTEQIRKGFLTTVIGGLTGLIASGMIIRTESYIVNTSKVNFDDLCFQLNPAKLDSDVLEAIQMD